MKIFSAAVNAPTILFDIYTTIIRYAEVGS